MSSTLRDPPYQRARKSGSTSLIACWTVSIFIGSVLKDRRLARYLGEDYRAYQARVPGYPGIPFGPLARLTAYKVTPW